MNNDIFSERQELADADSIERILDRLSDDLLAGEIPLERLALVGIYTAGVPLSIRLKQRILQKTGKEVPLGRIDISLYRDDALEGLPSPVVGETSFDFSIEGAHVVLVDDVLFTGRTIRAALDAVIDFGRPRKIELMVLVDRGHRELPIQANYVGMSVKTERSDNIRLHLPELGTAPQSLLKLSH